MCGKGVPKLDFVDETDQEVFVSDVHCETLELL